jgi:aminoglycoside phosphotransferase (APT) family kinase protein
MPDFGATNLIVRSPRALNTSWAQRVITGHAPGASVRSVETLGVEVGTTTRVRLAVTHDGPAELPRRWFVKLPSASWKARAIIALPRLPQTEVRFYREVAGPLPVARPRALAAASRFGRGFTLVLGDVSEAGDTAGRSGETINPEQANALIDLLAALHASHWEDPRLKAELAWLAGPVRRVEDSLGCAFAKPLMRRGLERAGDKIPARLHAPALRYASRRRKAMSHLASGPQTLVHHDCHPGNLFWRGDKPGLLDWQLVRIGEGVGDVAYLLATSLEPQMRREVEHELLTRYAMALSAKGIEVDVANLTARYRAHLTYAFEAMVVTLAIGGLMEDAIAMEMVRRTAHAVDDLDAFAALEEAGA